MASKPTQFDTLFQEAGSKHGVDPAILKAIASVESNFRPDAVGPRTRSGRAQGMMQFIPATARAYGLDDPFDPAKSVDAAARLMRDNLKQFKGDLGKALEAYNGGPKLVGKSRQTAAYREKVMQRAELARKDPQFKTQLAKTQTSPPMAGKSAPISRQGMPDTSALPVSYKAALALQYFTDTDPEGNPVESAEEELEKYIAEMEYEKEPAAGGQMLAKAFAAQKKEYVSPFDIMAGMQQPESVDQEPTRVAQAQGFADGGFVFRGTSLPGAPNWYLDPAADYEPGDRELISRNQRLLSGYNEAVKEYQGKVDQYNSLLDQYQKQAAEYNRQAEKWNAGPRTSDFRPTVKHPGEFNVKFEAKEPTLPFDPESFAAYVDLKNARIDQGRKKVEREAPGRQLALDVVTSPEKYNLSGFGFKDGGDVTKRGMMERVGQWLKENEISPTDFLMATKRGFPLAFALQPSSLNANEEEMLAAIRELQAEREAGKVVGRSKGSGPNAEESLSDDYSAMAEQMTLGTLPEGNKEVLQKVARDLARGTQYLPYDLLGGPVDIITMGMRPFGYNVEKPFLGSEYLIDKAVKAGIADKPTGSAAETTARIGMGFINPAQVIRGGVRLGEKAVQATEEAVMPVLRAQTGNPNLQPTDVYKAMADTKGIASLGAPAAAPTKINPGLFVSATEELDKFPVSSEVDNVLSAHIGGVGNLGDANAKYFLREVPGGPEYTQQSQAIAQKYFGDQFMGYRLMPKEEFEALKAGDVGDLLSFSLSKDAANAFRRFAPNQGREDLVLAEVPLTPRHILGFGHRGEQELIVDTSVGWSLDDFKLATEAGPESIYGGLAPVTEALLKKGEELSKNALKGKPSVVYDGMTYAGTPRVLAHIEKAEKIKQSLPPVQQGMTRLWRGNRPGEEGQNPSFTNSINGIALPFQEAYGGSLTYVDVPTNKLDSYLTSGAPGSEFMLPPELAAKAKIAKFPAPTASLERPFVGTLESIIADLPGWTPDNQPHIYRLATQAMQKEQFINLVKDKLRSSGESTSRINRNLQIRRIEDALEDYKPTDMLTPNQLMSALRRTSPQRYKLQIIDASDTQPRSVRFSRNVDNPFPARPIGAINLLLEPSEMQKQLNTIVEGIHDFRATVSTNSVFGNSPTAIDEYVRGVINLAERVDKYDTQLASSVKRAAEDVANQARPIVDLALMRQYVRTPELDPKNSWLYNWHDLEKTVPQEIKDILRERGVTTLTPEVANMAARELAAFNYLKEYKKTIALDNPYSKFINKTLSSYEKDDLDKIVNAFPTEISKRLESMLGLPDLKDGWRYWSETLNLDPFYKEASKLSSLPDVLSKPVPGEFFVTRLTPTQKNQRMSEIKQKASADIYGMLSEYDSLLNYSKNDVVNDLRRLTQGMLESDTLVSGKIYEGNPGHTGIVSQNPISFSRFVEVHPFDMDNPPKNMGEGGGLLVTELQSDRRGAIKRGERVEEPYPGFTKDPNTLRELMMKTAVAGAAQLNKKLVLFPSSDSMQPQLYGTWADKEMTKYYPSIMKEVSQKVAKDLGEGYEAREFTTTNGAGDTVIRWGIVLPDNVSKLPQKAIPFSKGGLVDKPLYDRA